MDAAKTGLNLNQFSANCSHKALFFKSSAHTLLEIIFHLFPLLELRNDLNGLGYAIFSLNASAERSGILSNAVVCHCQVDCLSQPVSG